MLADHVISAGDEEVLLRSVSPWWGSKWAALKPNIHPNEDPGVLLLQSLKINKDKVKIPSLRNEKWKQEQNISTQVHEECYEERMMSYQG